VRPAATDQRFAMRLEQGKEIALRVEPFPQNSIRQRSDLADFRGFQRGISRAWRLAVMKAGVNRRRCLELVSAMRATNDGARAKRNRLVVFAACGAPYRLGILFQASSAAIL
jgi:hypothetical protein